MASNIQLGQKHVLISQGALTAGQFVKLVQVRQSGVVLLPNTFDDIEFDQTDYETDTTFIEHNSTNTERIDIKVASYYLIMYTVPVDVVPPNLSGNSIETRVMLNGTTVLDGSYANGGTSSETIGLGNQIANTICRVFVAPLIENDYLTLQVQAEIVGTMNIADMTMIVYLFGSGKGSFGASGSLTNQGAWDSLTAYFSNDIVRHKGSTYIAIVGNLGNEPPSLSWDIVTSIGDIPIDWQGTWVSQDYTVNQAVTYFGDSYICILDTTSSQVPTNTTYWDKIAFQAVAGTTTTNNQKLFDAYHTASVTIATEPSYTDITLGTQRTIDSTAYNHSAGTAPITILESGRYIIYARMSTVISSGTARSTSRMRLQLNTGSGFATIGGTSASMYNRIFGNSAATGTCMLTLNLNAGDIIKLQAARHSGTDTIITISNGCGLVVVRLDAFDTPLNIQGAFFDDFMGTNLDNIWTTSVVGGSSSISIASSAIGGIVEIVSGTTATNNAELDWTNDSIRVSNLFTIKFRASLSHTTQSLVNMGLQLDANNLIDFQYNAAGSVVNWFARSISGGVTTSTSTGTFGDTSYHKFEIVAATSSKLIYKIDNVIVATITTNIPSGIQHIRMRQESNSAAARTLSVDYVSLVQTRA